MDSTDATTPLKIADALRETPAPNALELSVLRERTPAAVSDRRECRNCALAGRHGPPL
jgi:hypothetical protein